MILENKEYSMEFVQMQENVDHHMNMVIKRRRTKRPRPPSPLALTIATSSCSTVEGAGGDGGGELDGHVANSSSLSNCGIDQFAKNSEEEEDMANCLILLAQGHNQKSQSSSLDVFQCKTCNRCFSSFQALGGHRASHKKPKSTTQEEIKNSKPIEQVATCLKLNEDHVTTLSLQIPSNNNNNNNNNNSNNKNKTRVHECSICGAEFTSGQALGGHMRRHRPLPNSITIAASSTSNEESHDQTKSTRNFLSLDLNLPAPEDDHREMTKFSFASKEQVIVFSASPLVDCHY
ncbi:zinc finger protein ZAT5-like [Nicotiana tabacum]|uniref:Zinc finger protein ZAT5-like n=1 Tax=Nicotiana tabacum TaxID=4097 RepID=A0A1S4CJ85_TOBAC|nr:zinc finger protein ZAT5-like [Nicotiana tomentosiformis]XP_016501275.1 PREDICTED: zinc finger protein ZAT5-like [Nicotiana tabacum]